MALVADELSTLSPAAADDAAAGVRAAASAFTDITDQVSSARAGLGGWRGVAEAGFSDRVVDLENHLELLTWTAVAGADAIEEYARELGILQGRLRSVDVALEDVARRLADPTLAASTFATAWGEQERWTQSRLLVLDQFDQIAGRLADRLQSLVQDVPDRPRTLTEHVTDGAEVIADGVRSTAYLAAGWSWDRDGWSQTWRQLPGDLVAQARDPVGTTADAVQWDDIQAGRWGALGGGLAAGAVGGGLGRAVERAAPDVPGAGGRDRPRGPDGRFLPQTFDEMLAGIDLVRNDDHLRAHTVARHVAVDDEFLRRRLLTGDVGGGRSRPAPKIVSRWTDLTTAQGIITARLRDHEGEVRDWMTTTRDRDLVLKDAVAPSAGVAWTLVEGRPTMMTVTSSRIILTKAADGSVVVTTAYLRP